MSHKPQPPVCLLMVLQVKSQHRKPTEKNQLTEGNPLYYKETLNCNLQESLKKPNSPTVYYGSTEVKTNALIIVIIYVLIKSKPI